MFGLLCSSSYLYAQQRDYIFKNITVKDGLLGNNVTALLLDSEGFMWMGSQAGLQRFDGTRFKNYNANIRDTNALQSDWISTIFEDSKKRLWIGTDLGAPYLLDRTTGKFFNYNLQLGISDQIKGIWKFVEDKHGNIWMAGHDGWFKLNEKNNKFVNASMELGIFKNEKPGRFIIDKDNNFWLITSDGIKYYNTKEKRIFDKNNNPTHNPLFNIKEGISEIFIGDNYLWASALYDRLLYKYDFTTGKLKIFSFDKLPSQKKQSITKEFVGTVFQLKNKQIVVALPGRGIAYYNDINNNFSILKIDNSNTFAYNGSKESENFHYFLQDRNSNIIIGNESGIHIYNPDKQKFFQHNTLGNSKTIIPESNISDFLEMPNADILMSQYNYNGGIVLVDSIFNFKKKYLYQTNPGTNDPVNTNVIWNLFKDREGIIIAPNQSKTVLKINLQKEKIVEDADTLWKGPINIIKQDDDGIFWVGHWNKGLVKIDVVQKNKTCFSNFKTNDTSTKKRVYAILPEKEKIWVGTNQNGLQIFDRHTEKFIESFEVNINNKNAISSNTIKAIVRYNKDTLLLATFMGVNIFDTHKKKFTAITAKEGLPNNLTEGLVIDNNLDVWVLCSGYICKINLHTLLINTYDISDGITDDFLSTIRKLKNGKILVGTVKGFLSFDPSKFFNSTPPEKVQISGFSIFGKELFIGEQQKNNIPINLNYKENSLRIEFASLEFWAASHLKYFYKLQGVDKDWVLADKSQAAIYNQLNDGNYIFEIKCANSDGVFCKSVTQLKINIKPPFWKTWWFMLLIFLFVFLLIRQFIRWREKNIRAIEEEKLKVQELNAHQLKNKLELEQIINYFSSSLIDKNTVDAVLWDVAKNLIGRLGFVDCMMYLWNSNKTKMEQRAGYGPKGSIEEIENSNFDVLPGQGVVGYVIETKEAVVVADTSTDSRYRIDDIHRLSEITVPVVYNNELIGVIDSEHHEKNFFTKQHLQILTTIAALMANKINSIEASQSLQQAKIEVLGINEKLSEAKLAALRSQMNPHFIFNSLNAIQECILTNKVDAAYEYLSKFSKLQRMVLNNSAKEFIPLSNELEMLKLYLSLEFLRFNESFSYNIKIGEHTDEYEINVPSMLIQPYVENAVWHGLRTKIDNKTLMITCEEHDGELRITIDDNGIGRKAAELIKLKKIGGAEAKGTALSAERLSILALKYNALIKVETVDKLNSNNEPIGTTVVIKLPVNIKSIKK